MSVFDKIRPSYTPAHIAKQGQFAIWRERVLQYILIITLLVGGLAYLFVVNDAIIRKEWGQVIFLTLMVGIAAAIAVVRWLPYTLRAAWLAAVIYVLAVFSFLDNGLSGNARIFLLGFIIMVAVLLGLRAALIALAMSLGTMLLFAAGFQLKWFALPSLDLIAYYSLNRSEWILGSIVLAFLGIMGLTSMTTLLNSLQDNLKSQQKLTEELRQERSRLEREVQNRTENLERRLTQLHTSAEISRAIAGVLNPEELLQIVVNLIQEQFNLYYVGLFLIDERGEYAVLTAGTGDAGRRMIAANHRLAIGGSSMIGWSIANRKARIALDVGAEAVRFSNPYLPHTHSEVALPIIAYNNVLGALSIQSDQANAFDSDDLTILQNVADTLAITVENDRLFQETKQSLEEVRMLNRDYLQKAWAETIGLRGEIRYTYNNTALPAGATEPHQIQLPLKLRDEPIGYITLETDAADLTDEEKEFIESITVQTALALENARLLEQTQQRAMQEEKVNELTSRFSRALNIEDILKTAVKELGQLPNVAEVSVHLSPSESNLMAAEPAPGSNGKH